MIWAEARGGVIGAGGTMPWHVPEDLEHFKSVTMGAPVVMGRKTWESLPERFRPLPGRTNVVVTRNQAASAGIAESGAVAASSLDEALQLAQEHTAGAGRIWIMGGGAVYSEAVQEDLAQLAEVTRLDAEVPGDTHAPVLDTDHWELISSNPQQGWHVSSSGIGYRFETYRRI